MCSSDIPVPNQTAGLVVGTHMTHLHLNHYTLTIHRENWKIDLGKVIN